MLGKTGWGQGSAVVRTFDSGATNNEVRLNKLELIIIMARYIMFLANLAIEELEPWEIIFIFVMLASGKCRRHEHHKIGGMSSCPFVTPDLF